MKLSRWIRRSLSLSKGDQHNERENLISSSEDEELLGVTDELIQFVSTFTIDTFKDFQLPEENGHDDSLPTTSGLVRSDLSDWQTRHATLVLSKIKEISKLRYMLCPRHLKEHQFWRIYFQLVDPYVRKYELHAIRLEKMKQRALENKDPVDNGYEVEMAETNRRISSSIPLDQTQST